MGKHQDNITTSNLNEVEAGRRADGVFLPSLLQKDLGSYIRACRAVGEKKENLIKWVVEDKTPVRREGGER